MIAQCISTAHFSLLLQGSPFGYFTGSRGLRQDDVLLFSRAHDQDVYEINHCLDTYMQWSGQLLNRQKSAVYFSKNTVGQSAIRIAERLQLQRMSSKMRHLGLPLIFPRAKTKALDELKDRIFNRISGWKAKLLSQAARTSLISTVATSMPSYYMSSLLLPVGWCSSINQHLKNFWWGFNSSQAHHLTLKAWHSICLPKAMGGLGIRSLSYMNIALLARQGWMMLSDAPSLWVSLCKAKYLRHHSFGEGHSPRVASWSWRGIIKLLPYFRSFACKQIMNGESTAVWKDPWVEGLENFQPRARSVILEEWQDERVSSLISPSTHQWDRTLLHLRFDDETVSHILRIPLHFNNRNDRWVWTLESSGNYTSKSMYRSLLPQFDESSSPLSMHDWKLLWKLKIHARLRLLLWKLAWNILPTRTRIDLAIHNQVQHTSVCPLCEQKLESLQHLFLECLVSCSIWQAAPWNLRVSSYADFPMVKWISVILAPEHLSIPAHDIHYFQLFAVNAIDLVWQERNRVVHGQPRRELQVLLKCHQCITHQHAEAWRIQFVVRQRGWVPPSPGVIKVNVDAAVRSSFSMAACVCRDYQGVIIHAATKKLSSVDPTVGEAEALWFGVQVADLHSWPSVIFEGDSLAVIDSVKRPLADFQVCILSALKVQLVKWGFIPGPRDA